MILADGKKAAGDDHQNNSADEGQHDGAIRMVAKKMDACQQQQYRNPERTQAEQPDQQTGNMGSDNAEQIMNLACGPGVINGGIGGAEG